MASVTIVITAWRRRRVAGDRRRRHGCKLFPEAIRPISGCMGGSMYTHPSRKHSAERVRPEFPNKTTSAEYGRLGMKWSCRRRARQLVDTP